MEKEDSQFHEAHGEKDERDQERPSQERPGSGEGVQATGKISSAFLVEDLLEPAVAGRHRVRLRHKWLKDFGSVLHRHFPMAFPDQKCLASTLSSSASAATAENRTHFGPNGPAAGRSPGGRRFSGIQPTSPAL